MKKLMLAVAVLAGVALVNPAPAAAHGFSLSVALPGFGFFVSPPPCPRPVYYAPPVYYPPVYAPVYAPAYTPYWAPAPTVAFGVGHRGWGGGHYRGHWGHRGWYR